MLADALISLPAAVVAAFLVATLLNATKTLPRQNIFAATAVIISVSGLAAAACAKTAVPFGPLFYTDHLGGQLFHLLPWPVPLIWVVVIFNSRGVARLLLQPQRNAKHYGYWVMAWTCTLAVLLDLELEPAARADRFWFWRVSPSIPSWYGAPWINFFSWAAVTLLILGLILPWLIDKKVGNETPPDRLPLVLWLLAELSLSAINAAHSYWLAAGLGLCIVLSVGFFGWRHSRR